MSVGAEVTAAGAEQRVETMDVLRGFALLGILLVNIEGMVGPINMLISGTNLALTGADLWADVAVYILVQGKFYIIFSLLFGMGFATMLQRARAAERPFFVVYLRRLLALAIIGLAHGWLIWSGDILVTYAAFGLLMLILFRNTPQSRLPKYGLFLYLGPALLVVAIGAMASAAQNIPAVAVEIQKSLVEEQVKLEASIQAQRLAYKSGSLQEIFQQSARDMAEHWELMAVMGWQILGLFLLGAWFVKSGAIARPETYPRLYRSFRWIYLPVGLCLMICSFIMMPTYNIAEFDWNIGLASALVITAGLLMSLGYMGWIVKGMGISKWSNRLRHLAPVGKMALTNYLMQSLVGTMIFYNHGLGYYEQLPRLWQVPFAVTLFAAQVVLSKWWLNRFHYGPVEWVWRLVTYLKVPVMKKRIAAYPAIESTDLA